MYVSTKKMTKIFMAGLIAVGFSSSAAWAEDLTIQLPAGAAISKKVVQYQCDSQGPKIGVPSGSFPVEYINGGGNFLAVVPISGNSIVFSSVISGSGARYAAQQFIWWDAQGAVTLSADTVNGKAQSVCHVLQKN